MTESELIAKCNALAPAGDAFARAVLALLADRDQLRDKLRAAAGRIADQSEALSRVAQRCGLLNK